MIKTDVRFQEAETLEQVQSAQTDTLECFYRVRKRQAHRTLSGQVVDFVRLDLLDQGKHVPEVHQGKGVHLDLLADAQSDRITEQAGLMIARGSVNFVTLCK